MISNRYRIDEQVLPPKYRSTDIHQADLAAHLYLGSSLGVWRLATPISGLETHLLGGLEITGGLESGILEACFTDFEFGDALIPGGLESGGI